MLGTGSEASASASGADPGAADLQRWQHQLLPLMVRMLVGLAVFFFVASLGQLGYLHWRMEQAAPVDIHDARLLVMPSQGASELERQQAALLLLRGLLEADALQRRHHQARVLLMARTWIAYLGFVTGMSLALLGSAFTLGRVQGLPTTVKFDAGGLKAEILASAPGLVLAFLGVILMTATLLINHTISVEDKNIYLVSDPPSSSPDSKMKPFFPDLNGTPSPTK
jgi:hypothetical protein